MSNSFEPKSSLTEAELISLESNSKLKTRKAFKKGIACSVGKLFWILIDKLFGLIIDKLN